MIWPLNISYVVSITAPCPFWQPIAWNLYSDNSYMSRADWCVRSFIRIYVTKTCRHTNLGKHISPKLLYNPHNLRIRPTFCMDGNLHLLCIFRYSPVYDELHRELRSEMVHTVLIRKKKKTYGGFVVIFFVLVSLRTFAIVNYDRFVLKMFTLNKVLTQSHL